MFRAGPHACVSTNDQQTLAGQNRAMREYAPGAAVCASNGKVPHAELRWTQPIAVGAVCLVQIMLGRI